MTQTHATETLTYAALVDALNALGAATTAASNARTGQANVYAAEQAPIDSARVWRITIRRDPHRKLLDAVRDMLQWDRSTMLGMVALREDGDRTAKIRLSGFYEALSRLIPRIEMVVEPPETEDGATQPETVIADVIKTAADWRRALEDETDATYAVEHIAVVAYYLAIFRQIDTAGKSAAPSTATTTGETTA